MKMSRSVLVIAILVFFGGFVSLKKRAASTSANQATVVFEPAQPAQSVQKREPTSVSQKAMELKPDPGAKLDAAVLRFQKNSQKTWQLRKNPLTGQVKTYSAGEIVLAGESNEERAQTFLAAYAKDLFGVDTQNLQLQQPQANGRERLVYQETASGVPVYTANVVLVFDGDRLTRIQNDLTPVLEPIEAAPKLSASQAQAQYLESERQFFAANAASSQNVQSLDPSSGDLILYPHQGSLIWAYHFSYSQNQVGQQSILANMEAIVNASTGQLIKKSSTLLN